MNRLMKYLFVITSIVLIVSVVYDIYRKETQKCTVSIIYSDETVTP